MNQQEFLNLLKKYEEAYYSGEPLVSDEEYDVLKEQYVSQYGEYDFVPSEGDTGFKRVKHLYPLKSLDKVQLSDKDKLRKEITRLWPIVIMPKFDGLSIEIQPNLKFITRGNGEKGDDVTAQCMQITDIDELKGLKFENNGPLRAEIIMTHSDFNTLNAERETAGLKLYDNCRNTAAGMLRNLDLNKVKGLTVMIYENLGSTSAHSLSIQAIESTIGQDVLDRTDNIRITPVYKPVDIDAALNFLDNLENFRKLIDYDIDGWVVKSDLDNSLEHFGGYTGHHPKNAFSVKGEAKGEWTKINSITWQVGKENITPVAELEPVYIEGSTISRATLHNVSFLKAIGLDDIIINGGRTLVKVVKANDVIPKIIKVKKEYDSEEVAVDTVQAPTKCPICGGETAIKDSDSDSEILICTNEDCSAKIQAKAELMASRDALDITGLSEGTIAKILDTYEVNSHEEILSITKEHLLALDGFAEKSAQSLYDAMQKAIKKQPIDKVLYASAIPLIGKSTAKDICKVYTIEELSNILAKSDTDAVKDLCKIKGIGKETANSLVKHKDKFRLMFVAINEVTDIAVKDNNPNKEQYSICITGQREPFKTIIESAGHKVTSSVSKKTKALIAADGDLTTSKAVKAIELKIPIIKTVEELEELLK
jgi:DNA ligase (NAD+)